MKLHFVNKISSLIKLFFALLFLMLGSQSYAADRVVKVEVKDQSGLPVPGAVVSASFPAKFSKNNRKRVAKTNADGIAVISGKSRYKIAVRVEKIGYYSSRFVDQSSDAEIDLKFVLREMRNPVAMYVKKAELTFPKLETAVGFDLEVGDWVSPFGTGLTPDLIMLAKLNRSGFTYLRYSIQLSFNNNLDGVISYPISAVDRKSSFPFIYSAPESGYSSSLQYLLEVDESSRNSNVLDHAYVVFRVRTASIDGEMVSANYGKIYPVIQFANGFVDKPGVNFVYYFNPTKNDRNLEFDVNRNLFVDDEIFPTKFSP